MATKSVDVSNQSRNRRLLALKEIFEEHTDADNGIKMKDIRDHLRAYGVEADRRTIYEDIELLRHLAKMDIEHGTRDRYYKLRSRLFSVAELKLIVDSMASSKVLTPELTQELTTKLATLCSKNEREYLKKKIFLDGRVKSQNKKIPSYIKTLNEGIIKQRWVAFRYFRYDLNKKKNYYFGGKHRRVRPAALMIINDVYYLLAYDKRDTRKMFRIDRMSHVVIHSEGFQYLPEKVTFQVSRLAFTEDNLYYTHPAKEAFVTLRCRTPLVDAILDKFGFAIQLIPEDEYYFRTTVKVEPTNELFGWLLSVGSGIEIVSPESVRSAMRNRVWSAYMHHRKK